MNTSNTEAPTGTQTTTQTAAAQKPKPAKNARAAQRGRNAATTKAKSTKKAYPAKKVAKGPKKAASANAESPREGSKTATILDLLHRAKGATLAEIMETTSWQAHSVRGFISGTLTKKMGLTVNSEKREDGARVYSIVK